MPTTASSSAAQPLAAGHHLADPVEQLLQQLVEVDPGQGRQRQRRLPRRQIVGHTGIVCGSMLVHPAAVPAPIEERGQALADVLEDFAPPIGEVSGLVGSCWAVVDTFQDAGGEGRVER